MEDTHICQPKLYAASGDTKIDLPDHAMFAVMDGHGGKFAAEYAGANFCRVLSRQPKFIQYAEFVQDRPEKETKDDTAKQAQYLRQGLELLEASLKDAFVDCDREILLALQGMPEPDAHTPYHPEATKPVDEVPLQPSDDEDPGTTIVVVVVTPDWVVCANAGDSRAVFSKNGGKAVPLSYDHKPDDEVEERRIRDAGGYVAGGRVEGDLAVSRGLGDYRFKELNTVLKGAAHFENATNNSSSTDSMLLPEDQKVSPLPDVIVQTRNQELDEFIIIACDGIWDVQTNYEGVKLVKDIFREGEKDLGLVCEEVLDLCLQYGSKDNMTALILKFDAQKIGEGGGVLARRKKRDDEAEQNTTHQEEKNPGEVKTSSESA